MAKNKTVSAEIKDEVTSVDEIAFEEEKTAGLKEEQLSYICEYCGKVNAVSNVRCARCGKRRPRNEYIAAVTKMNDAKDVREKFIEKQSELAEKRSNEDQRKFERKLEDRLEEERQGMVAQQAKKLEQETDAIRKELARDAVLKVIAAENAADDRIVLINQEAEKRVAAAESKVKDLEQQILDIYNDKDGQLARFLADERDAIDKLAGEKIVLERAAIEKVAQEQIEANRKLAEKTCQEAILEEKDKADRNAAREAVLRIIAMEKAADDKVRAATEAIHNAAVQRIIEERIIADKEASAKFLAEKQAIERASDERIKAERAAVQRMLEAKGNGGYGAMPQYGGAQTVQPFAIVPYVSSSQPVYQYRPTQVYRFVPAQPVEMLEQNEASNQSNKKRKK